MRSITMLSAALLVMACGGDDDDSGENRPDDGRVATAFASGSDRLTAEQLEAGRLNMDWREFIERDTTAGAAGDTTAAGEPTGGATSDETWDDISVETVNSGPVSLPLSGDVEGPSVLRVQILLDRARFSPGIIDGRWGSNTEKAVYFLQKREGLRATGHVDRRTWERLVELGAESSELVRTVTLSSDDVAGPFVTLPAEYYDRRDMDCQCYESLAEKLAETYHTSEDLLGKLNPDVDLNAVQAGQRLNVPHVASGGGAESRPGQASGGNAAASAQDTSRRAQSGGAGTVARIVISGGGRYLHALDASGRILYHFPATLGSDYSPSPSGDYSITNIAHDPTWHYQPDLLEGVDDDEPDAVLPAGPNNAVGVVWMQLSQPHYGIHGTSAPETIGYATSNGCVRLTNWDAEFLSHRVEAGTPVEFRDVR